MPFQILRSFFTIFAVSLILCGAKEGFAQKIKVKKTKGHQALIESSVPLEEGQVYDLAVSPVAQNIDYKNSGPKSRRNSLSLGGSISILRGDDYQKNFYSVQGRYGWNFSNLEFGIVGGFSSDDMGSGATSEFVGGGYFDYNLVPNRSPQDMVYGVVTLLTFGSRSFSAASGGGSATTLEANAGGFLSWFFTSTTSALRLEGFFNFQQISTTAKQTNVTGFGSRALMVFYF